MSAREKVDLNINTHQHPKTKSCNYHNHNIHIREIMQRKNILYATQHTLYADYTHIYEYLLPLLQYSMRQHS